MPNNLTDYGENQLLVWQLTTTTIAASALTVSLA